MDDANLFYASKQARKCNYSLICRTHQHYRRQWPPNNEWSNSRSAMSKGQMAVERLWEKEILR